MLKDFLLRFTARKFLLTVVFGSLLFSVKQYNEMVMLIVAFLGVEGGADLVSKYKTGTLIAPSIESPVSQNDEDAPDTSKIESGKPTPTPLFDESPKE